MLQEKMIRFYFLLSLLLLSQGCSRAMLSEGFLGGDKLISQLQIFPANATIEVGSQVQLTVMAMYADNTMEDVTSKSLLITYAPTVVQVAEVGDNTMALGLTRGTGVVSALYGGVLTYGQVNVTNASLNSIEITPSNANVNVGVSQGFVATGLYSDSTRADLTGQASWVSLNPAVAAVSDQLMSKGLLNAKSVGSAVISATFHSDSGTTSLSVGSATILTIYITPVNTSIAVNSDIQYMATALYSDGSFGDITASVPWTSSSPSVASITPLGKATSLSAGQTVIGATLGPSSATTNLTVNAVTMSSLQITSTNSSGVTGGHEQFHLSATYSDGSVQDVTEWGSWSSSNASVASVSDVSGTKGYVTANAAGSANILATLGGLNASAPYTVTAHTLSSIAVTPLSLSLAAGVSAKLKATGTYSNGSTKDITSEVVWSSSQLAYATVSNAVGNNGVVSPIALGNATITATSGIRSGSASLSVTNAFLQSITLNPTTPSTALGKIKKITAIGHYSNSTTADITHLVLWSTNMPMICNPSNATGFNGFIYTLAQGAAHVMASLDGVSEDTILTVTAPELVSISITPVENSLVHIGAQQLHAIGHYTDGTVADITNTVTWSVSNSLGTIGSTGLFVGVSVGGIGVTAVQGLVTKTNLLTISL